MLRTSSGGVSKTATTPNPLCTYFTSWKKREILNRKKKSKAEQKIGRGFLQSPIGVSLNSCTAATSHEVGHSGVWQGKMIPFPDILAKESVRKSPWMLTKGWMEENGVPMSVDKEGPRPPAGLLSFFVWTPSDLGRLMEDSCELQAQFFKGG